MWIPLTTFGLIVTGMAIFGFYDKAKYRAAHPEEFAEKKEHIPCGDDNQKSVACRS